MPLSMVHSGESVKVLAVNGPHAMQMRLINLGIMPGVMVQIITRDSASLLLKIKSTRLMLHCSIAHQVQVQ